MKDFAPDSGPDGKSSTVETPAPDDEVWPAPTRRTGEGPRQWAQIRLGDDHYFAYTDPVQLEIQEGEPSEVVFYGYDEEGRSLTAGLFQSTAWPPEQAYELSDEFRDLRHTTRMHLKDADDSNRWASMEGRVFDVEVSSDGETIAGKFEAALESRPDGEESREVEGAFRGGFDVDCAFRIDEVNWENDPHFESDFCSEYEHWQEML